jgi:DNA-binding transcriptional LysR family regulator
MGKSSGAGRWTGRGYLQIPTGCAGRCARRLLAALLPDYQTERAPLYLVCPHRMMLSPLVVRLREFQLRSAQHGDRPGPSDPDPSTSTLRAQQAVTELV